MACRKRIYIHNASLFWQRDEEHKKVSLPTICYQISHFVLAFIFHLSPHKSFGFYAAGKRGVVVSSRENEDNSAIRLDVKALFRFFLSRIFFLIGLEIN
jgi:hypothetical protein